MSAVPAGRRTTPRFARSVRRTTRGTDARHANTRHTAAGTTAADPGTGSPDQRRDPAGRSAAEWQPAAAISIFNCLTGEGRARTSAPFARLPV